jgi:uncharacterized protein (TIGR02996 family)
VFYVIVTAGDPTTQQRLPFVHSEIDIGRTADNHVELPSPRISKRHARIVVRAGKYVVVDMKSANGTYVDGRRIEAPVIVKPGDSIAIAEFTLRIAEVAVAPVESNYVPRDAIEDGLLRAVAADDAASRVVYADWLEERGDAERAELTRLLDAAASPPSRRALELATRTDACWRARVARSPIERCGRDDCPKRWSALAPTEHDGERRCHACHADVPYCVTVAEARRHDDDAPVAFDITTLRWRDDLA